MLKPQDVEITVFHGPDGDSMKVLHKPTGIFRAFKSPMSSPGKSKRQAVREIEAELKELGLTQHLLLPKR
jgi:hypothetical protein